MHANMILLTLNIYPVSITIFCWTWFCGIYSLMINPITIFKSDVIMMKYVVRVKPLDV